MSQKIVLKIKFEIFSMTVIQTTENMSLRISFEFLIFLGGGKQVFFFLLIRGTDNCSNPKMHIWFYYKTMLLIFSTIVKNT